LLKVQKSPQGLAQSTAMMNHPDQRTHPKPELRSAYAAFRQISTRWADNDAYGHVNNVVYYAWFDTAVNAYLIEQGVLDIHQGETIGLVVETHCNYFSPISFPQPVEIGIRVAYIGSASVRYELGVFISNSLGEFDVCAAKGHFVHVYVDKLSRRPAPVALKFQSVLEKLKNVANNL
jgi:acyl-CoA thioester hydrolase